MRDLTNGEITKDEDVIFCDGIIKVLYSTNKDDELGEWKDIVVCGEYDDAISLKDIETDYPTVEMVFFDDMMEGEVYRYGNHPNDGEMWEKIGTTVGYA